MALWNRRRDDGRREARSTEELVAQIAADKSISRFAPRVAGTEKPRDVFLEAVGLLAAPHVARGWRFAVSGPHLTRKSKNVSCRVQFGSSSLNVAGELVSLRIDFIVRDAEIGGWRMAAERPRRQDDVVLTRHLGHLLDPPRWLEWNLANSQDRSRTIADASETLSEVGMPYIETLASWLSASELRPLDLAGYVDEESLIEYYVRAGMIREAADLISAIIDRLTDRGRDHFFAQVERFRADGLPAVQSLGLPNGLAFLVVQHDLSFES